MIKMTCDICKLELSEYTDLYVLPAKYSTYGVEHVCKSCQKDLVDAEAKFAAIVNRVKRSWYTEFVTRLREIRVQR